MAMIHLQSNEVESLPITVYSVYLELAYKLIGAFAVNGFDLSDKIAGREKFLKEIDYFKSLGWFK